MGGSRGGHQPENLKLAKLKEEFVENESTVSDLGQNLGRI